MRGGAAASRSALASGPMTPTSATARTHPDRSATCAISSSYGSRDNVQVIDVYDSPESLERFGKTLGPILEEMGIKAQPEVQDAFRVIKG